MLGVIPGSVLRNSLGGTQGTSWHDRNLTLLECLQGKFPTSSTIALVPVLVHSAQHGPRALYTQLKENPIQFR